MGVDSFSHLLHNLGNSLELEELFSTLDQDLQRLICADGLDVILAENDGFAPAYLRGGMSSAVPLDRVVREHRAVQYGRVLAFPIETANEVIAVLLVRHRQEKAFTAADIQILRDVTPKLRAAIENALTYRRARELAEADPETGLANLRSLFQRLDAELARARRGSNTLAVIDCSIEGFERSGRLAPPTATRSAFEKVAERLRENCREYDLLARSGDDLLLVLPGFQKENLEDKRSLIARLVEEIGVGSGFPLFAAVGAAFFPEDGADAEDLLATAARRAVEDRQAKFGTECPRHAPTLGSY
jgi:diguanylate cyclase (GGDEF)-like protein